MLVNDPRRDPADPPAALGAAAPFGANPGDNASVDETAVTVSSSGIYEYPAEVVRRRAAEAEAATALVREILEAVCLRDGLSLESSVEPGKPARNYELALRLNIGHVFGLGEGPRPGNQDDHGATLRRRPP